MNLFVYLFVYFAHKFVVVCDVTFESDRFRSSAEIQFCSR